MFSEKWHLRFMEVAQLVATWSKDTSTKVGAIVVGPDREIRSTGYNGLVRGVDDNKPERLQRPTKYDFFEHAERNAIYNACLIGASLKGCVIYVTYMPCPDCARAIIQSGIKMVVTYPVELSDNLPADDWRRKLVFSEEMFEEAGVEIKYLSSK